MANPEDTIRLVVDVGSSAQDIRAVTKEVDLLDVATQKVTRSAERAAAAKKKLADADEEVKKGGANAGRSVLELSRGLQDFTQGGLPGILNNIEGLARALGGGAGLAGVMTAVGVAAYLASPYLKQFWDYLNETAEAVPKANKGLADYQAELAGVNKELGELAAKEKLTNDEFARRGVLLDQQRQAEKQVEAIGEREGILKRMRKFRPAAEVEAGKEFEEAVGEDVEGLQKSLYDVMIIGIHDGLARLDDAAKKKFAMAQKLADFPNTRKRLEEEGEAIMREAQDLRDAMMTRAQEAIADAARGIPGAVEQLQKWLPSRARELARATVGATQGRQHEAVMEKWLHRMADETKKIMDAKEKALDEWEKEQDAALEAEARRLKDQAKQLFARQTRDFMAMRKPHAPMMGGPEGMPIPVEEAEDVLFGGARQLAEVEALNRGKAARERRQAARDRARDREVPEAPTGTELGVGGGVGAAAMRAPQLQKELAEAEARGLQAILTTLVPLAGQVAMWRKVPQQLEQTARDLAP